MTDQSPPPDPPTNPYGQPYQEAAPPYYGGPGHDYASWFKRVGAYLIDGVISLIASIPLIIGYVWLLAGLETTTDATGRTTATGDVSPAAVGLVIVGAVVSFAVTFWNYCMRMGRIGYTVGKGVVGIKLIKEQTGEPIGTGMAFLRLFVHYLDSLPCYLGWLWPLWDNKRQTFADKIMKTVVVVQPPGP